MTVAAALDGQDEVRDADRRVVQDALDQLLSRYPPSSTPPSEFLGARYDAGLAWLHFEPGLGGLGVPAALQPLVNETLAEAGAPDPNPNYVGVHQAATAIHNFAHDELKHLWLRPAFANEEFWCQLFSEPGAGSDVAALSTTATRDGDDWRVNGQKVWTSLAHVASWALLLARTDPDVPKHLGLTLFVVDMRDPGVDVRPLRTMDGMRHFNEVFLTNVRVLDDHRLGDVGDGWRLSQHLLSTEREGVTDHESLVPWLLRVWRDRPSDQLDAVLRDRVMTAYVANEVARLLTLRARQSQGREGAGSFAPVVKLARNTTDQRIANLAVDLLGPAGMTGGDYDWHERGEAPNDQMRFLRSRSFTIGGGTAQIMRNLIAERLLALPREPSLDRGVPWSSLKRS
jgi:alkylation response protein AidB-like acyl-CoA dehydrogenase